MPLKIKVMAVVIFMDTHAGETLFKMLISNIQHVITIMPARITISDNTLAIFLFFSEIIFLSIIANLLPKTIRE